MHWIRRLRPRFGLNLLLMTVTLFAVAFGWIAHERVEYQNEQQILAQLRHAVVIPSGPPQQLFLLDAS